MNKRTQFERIPDGVKTPLMLQVEKRIGATLEEDYRSNYLSGKMGQKRLADRWGVARGLVFSPLRGGRRNWVQKLSLPPKGGTVPSARRERLADKCEICDDRPVPLEAAHWIPDAEGGSRSADNILRLCPNCHAKLDRSKDELTTRRAREILLLRAADSFVRLTRERGEQIERRFLDLCLSIIERKPHHA
jgi:hypothetical protein